MPSGSATWSAVLDEVCAALERALTEASRREEKALALMRLGTEQRLPTVPAKAANQPLPWDETMARAEQSIRMVDLVLTTAFEDLTRWLDQTRKYLPPSADTIPNCPGSTAGQVGNPSPQ